MKKRSVFSIFLLFLCCWICKTVVFANVWEGPEYVLNEDGTQSDYAFWVEKDEDDQITDMKATMYYHSDSGEIMSTITVRYKGIYYDGVPVKKVIGDANLNISNLFIPEGIIEIEGFRDCDNLVQVSLPHGLEIMNAFMDCSSLIQLSIPETVTTLCKPGDKNILEAIEWPAGIPLIESHFFEGYSALWDVQLPASLKEIGIAAFANTPSLCQISLPEGLEIIGQDAFSRSGISELCIPDSVTSLGTLGMNETLKKVRWPAGIEVIPAKSFQNYTMLEEVVISEGVTELADYNYGGTFSGCTSLKRVTFPKTLKRIGDESFEGDIGLTELHNLEFVQEIGNRAFKNCPCPESLTIGAKSIEWEAFMNAENLTQVELLDGLERIENNVFCGSGIYDLAIPDSVTSIGTLGMADTLKRVVWPAGVQVVPAKAFQNYTALEEAVISEGVTELADYDYGGTFIGCTSLKRVTFPTTLRRIGNESFEGDIALSEINNLEYVQEIGNRAFKNTLCPENLTIGAKNIEWEAFMNAEGLKQVNLSEGIESIGNNVFRGSGITELSIPDSVTSLGTIGMADTLKRLEWPAGVNVVPANALQKYTVLEEVVLSEGVTELADYNNGGTFTSCTSLKRVFLPTTLRRIGDESFEGDKALTEIYNLEYVQEIGNRAFKNCSCPESLTIGAKRIEGEAFMNASGLTQVTLLDGLETLENNVFSGSGITELVIPNSVTFLGTLGMADTLKSVTWPAGIEEVSVNSFYAYKVLEEVILPEGVTSIADFDRTGAFTRCSALRRVEFPASLRHVGSAAFDGCQSLSDIYCAAAYEDWMQVSIASYNEALLNAKCHFTKDFVHCISFERIDNVLIAEIEGNVKAKGILGSDDSPLPTLEMAGVIQCVFTEVSPEGNIALEIPSSDKHTWRAYVIYEDKNGNDTILYSQVED